MYVAKKKYIDKTVQKGGHTTMPGETILKAKTEQKDARCAWIWPTHMCSTIAEAMAGPSDVRQSPLKSQYY